MLRTLVSFANTAGGKILIGIEDADHAVCGVTDPLVLEERLASLIVDSIAPKLVPDIEILPWRRTQVLAITVFPSQNRPHYLIHEGTENGVYVRVGSTNRRADAALIAEMRLTHWTKVSTSSPCQNATRKPSTSESFAAVRALAWIGPSHADTSLASLRRAFPHSEWQALASVHATLPDWIAQAIG